MRTCSAWSGLSKQNRIHRSKNITAEVSQNATSEIILVQTVKTSRSVFQKTNAQDSYMPEETVEHVSEIPFWNPPKWTWAPACKLQTLHSKLHLLFITRLQLYVYKLQVVHEIMLDNRVTGKEFRRIILEKLDNQQIPKKTTSWEELWRWFIYTLYYFVLKRISCWGHLGLPTRQSIRRSPTADKSC